MLASETAPQGSDVRRRILEAAATEFAEHGFGGAGVDEIARRAGVNKAMLYYHVGDKAALFAEVVRINMEGVRDAVAEALAGLEDPRERLRAIPRAIAKTVGRRRYLPKLMLREIAAGGPNLPQEVLVTLAEIMGMTRGVVEDGAADGAFRPVDPFVTHLMLVGSLMFMANALALRPRFAGVLPLPPDSPDELARLTEQMLDIALNGIAVEKDAGGN